MSRCAVNISALAIGCHDPEIRLRETARVSPPRLLHPKGFTDIQHASTHGSSSASKLHIVLEHLVPRKEPIADFIFNSKSYKIQLADLKSGIRTAQAQVPIEGIVQPLGQLHWYHDNTAGESQAQRTVS